jgi:signal transduction histidine kinase
MNTQFQGKRKEIYRNLSRVNTLAALVALLALGLAIVAILKSKQAKDHAELASLNYKKAEAERLRASSQLWEARVAQARAWRFSGQPGRRTEAVKQLTEASRIARTTELRTELAASLSLADIDPAAHMLPGPKGAFPIGFDRDVRRAGFSNPSGAIELYALDGRDAKATVESGISNPSYLTFNANGNWAAVRNARKIALLDVVHRKSSTMIEAPFGMHAKGAMDFAPDSETFAYGSSEGVVALARLDESGAWTHATNRYSFPGSVHSLRFSPDGRSLAVVVQDTVHVISLQSGKETFAKKLNANGTSVSWHPTGRWIAVAEDFKLARVFDLTTGESSDLEGHTGPVVNVVFHPTDDVLLSFSWDGTTRLWNYKLRTQILLVDNGRGMHFSRDGKRLAFIKTGVGAGYWDYHEGSIVRMWKGPNFEFLSGVIHPAGDLAATAGWDGIFLWKNNGEPAGKVNFPGACAVLFESDGKHLLGAGYRGLYRWELAREGELVKAINPAELMPGIGQLVGMDRSGDQRLLLKAGGAVVRASQDFTESKTLLKHYGANRSFIDPQKHWVAVSAWHGHGAALYDFETGKLLRKLDTRDSTVAGSSDGKLLIVATPEEVVLWNADEWQVIRKIPREGTSEAPGEAAIAEKRQLLALTRSSTVISLYTLGSFQHVCDLISPAPKSIRRISFEQEENKLMVVCNNGNVQLWDLTELDHRLAGASLSFAEPAAEWKGSLGNMPEIPKTISGNSGMFYVAISLAVLCVGLCALVIHEKQRTLLTEVSDLDRKLTQAQAEVLHTHKMRALGTLAAGVAHDFNNLLSVIRMAGRLTTRHTQGSEEAQENLAVIEQAVAQGRSVVKSMLGFTREDLEEGLRFSAAELIEDAVPLLNKQFLSGITLKLELDYQAPLVQGDKSKIQQILMNLVVNASEALNCKGSLKIAVWRGMPKGQLALQPAAAEQYVTLTVSDTGPGIPPQFMERIFEPFFTTKEPGNQGGTGLGLSIVYAAAQQQGFGIGVENHPGQGAAFHVVLPATPTSEQTPVQQMHSSQAAHATL